MRGRWKGWRPEHPSGAEKETLDAGESEEKGQGPVGRSQLPAEATAGRFQQALSTKGSCHSLEAPGSVWEDGDRVRSSCKKGKGGLLFSTQRPRMTENDRPSSAPSS